jgi:hypothetical protein
MHEARWLAVEDRRYPITDEPQAYAGAATLTGEVKAGCDLAVLDLRTERGLARHRSGGAGVRGPPALPTAALVAA